MMQHTRLNKFQQNAQIKNNAIIAASPQHIQGSPGPS